MNYKLIKNPALHAELEDFENKQVMPIKFLQETRVKMHLQVIKRYKIGVLYCKEGQTSEDEMFCNGKTRTSSSEPSLNPHSHQTEGIISESGSVAFESFLDFLGDRVELLGWKNYRAGLDVNGIEGSIHSYISHW